MININKIVQFSSIPIIAIIAIYILTAEQTVEVRHISSEEVKPLAAIQYFSQEDRSSPITINKNDFFLQSITINNDNKVRAATLSYSGSTGYFKEGQKIFDSGLIISSIKKNHVILSKENIEYRLDLNKKVSTSIPKRKIITESSVLTDDKRQKAVREFLKTTPL